MAEAGILLEEDRVELIGGEIVERSPIGGRHAACVRGINHPLGRRLGDELRVEVPCARTSKRSRNRASPRLSTGDNAGSLPAPEGVLLPIKAAGTPLAYDRGVKLPLYARRGTSEVWIVDLDDVIVERYTEPPENGYRLVRRVARACHPGGRHDRLNGSIRA